MSEHDAPSTTPRHRARRLDGRWADLVARIATASTRTIRRSWTVLVNLYHARRLRTVVRWSARVTLALIAVATVAVARYAASVPLPNDPVAPQASEIFFRDGHTLLARVGIMDRTDVALAEIPVGVRQAVMAAEDRDFYHHSGISVRGLLRATWANASGAAEGASTITQQYARNAYLTQDRTIGRKAKEIVLATRLEQRYTKDEILDRYLNAIYFGRGAYGIAAAARAYFGVDVGHLTLAQGAVLAAVIKDPWNFDPSVSPAEAMTRWRWIIDSMVRLGWVSATVAEALSYPAVLAEAPTDTTPGGINGLLVGLVERELNAHGISSQQLHTGGLRVVSTFDAHDQQAALDAVADGMRGLDPGIHTALVAIEPASGGILAYYGGGRGSGFFDDATAPRPPASTFKPITLAAGLQRGVSYQSIWNGSSPRLFHDRNGAPLSNADNQQCPVCPLNIAMIASLNTPFYALAQRLGGPSIRNLALALGIPDSYNGQPSLTDGKGDPWPGRTRADITLGIYPVSPIDLTSVYATFASGGNRITPYAVLTVADQQGEALYEARPTMVQVIAPAVAADVTTVLSEVVAKEGLSIDRPAAGKTGTQQWGNTTDNQDAWMAGYVPQVAAAVWVGRPVPGPISYPGGPPIEGKNVPTRIWSQFLTRALAGQPATKFPPPAHLGRDVGDVIWPRSSPQPPGQATSRQ